VFFEADFSRTIASRSQPSRSMRSLHPLRNAVNTQLHQIRRLSWQQSHRFSIPSHLCPLASRLSTLMLHAKQILMKTASSGSTFLTAKAGSGENEETFSLYKKLICQKVTFFDKVFNSQFTEGTSQQATLPEVGPKAFHLSRA
jgi:hypothetical protein